MNEKNIFKSKVMQGLLITLFGAVLTFLVEQQFISEEFYAGLARIIGYLAEAAGIPYAFYGRVVTNGEKLTLLPSNSKQADEIKS